MNDWNRYYNTCSTCRQQWHASEGSCECGGPVECQRERLRLHGYELDLDTMQWEQTISRKTRVCRKDHTSGRIKRGDTYVETVLRSIDDETGESWHSKRLRLVSHRSLRIRTQ
jgi:hypothetical protein